MAAEDKRARKRQHHLHRFYAGLIETVQGAERLYLFGPGTAKEELAKKLRKSKPLAAKIAAVDTVDKMTEPQIVAKVRQFFGGQNAGDAGRKGARK